MSRISIPVPAAADTASDGAPAEQQQQSLACISHFSPSTLASNKVNWHLVVALY